MPIELVSTQREKNVAGAHRTRIRANAAHQNIGIPRQLLARASFGDVFQTSLDPCPQTVS
jgi:hypothetical protein